MKRKRKKTCKYCEGTKVVVINYNKKEAKVYAEHLKHKHTNQ